MPLPSELVPLPGVVRYRPLLRVITGALIVLASGLLGGCAGAPVSLRAGGDVSSLVGDDYWSRDVAEVWLPRTRTALLRFNELAQEQVGQTLRDPPRVIVTSDQERARNARSTAPDAFVVALERKGNQALWYDQSVRQPLRAYAMSLQQELAAHRAGRAPQWMREGSADLIAYLVMDRMGGEISSRDWNARNAYVLRNTSGAIASSELLTATSGMDQRPGFQQASGLMASHLNELLGKRFFAAWATYFRRTAAPDFRLETDFRTAFGIDIADFLRSFDTRLTTLRAEVRRHNQSVPEGSGYADIHDRARLPVDSDDRARLPVDSENARKGYDRYLAGRAPKAFALSLRGFWSYSLDDSDAISKALAGCRRSDPTSCQLYAVDDRVVYKPAAAGAIEIEVVMASRGDDAWARSVRERWYPAVMQSAQQFNRLIKERIGVALTNSIRIHVVASQNDYERVLKDEMRLLASEASDNVDSSGGLSNGRGQIAIVFPPGNVERLRERAIKTTLHELAHELQAQLARRYRGFAVPKWIQEGTADLLAYETAQELSTEGAAQYSAANWKNRCVRWYKQGGRQATPEDVSTTQQREWLKMVRQREGPYQMAGLMAIYLQSRLGEHFYRAWVQYFELAGQPGQQEQAAFQQSFGLTRAEFLDGFKAWLRDR